MSFWGELKRRNVVKVAIAYLIVAWLILQIVSIIFPMFHMPEWTGIFVTVLLIIGFPLVLIFAWAFEITPEGLKLTKDVPHQESITHLTGQKLNYILIGVIVLGVAYILFDNLYLDRRAMQTDTPKTIAVLPFADLSPEKDQEYFVDGLTEELLNSLAKIPELTVTARTSSFTFKNSEKKIPEIADELGVAHILEGSVRKSGDALRITAQLIKGADGSHLWSNTYDRELKDTFAIQEDIATAVANELKVKLGVGESPKQLGSTDNKEAYELYLVAKGILSPSGEPNPEDPQIEYAKILESLELIDSAIALDNEFALAWVLKADALFRIEDVNGSLMAVQKSIELEPNLTEGYFELAMIRSLQGEYAKAILAYKKAAEATGKPLGAIPAYVRGLIMGCYFEKAREAAEEALRIDPLNEEILSLAIDIYGRLGDLQRAEEAYERIKAIIGYDPRNERRINGARLLSGNVVSSDDIVDPNPIMVALKEYAGSPQEGLAELHRFYNDDDYQDMPSLMSMWMWAAYFGDTEFVMEIMDKINPNTDIVWYPAMKQVRQLPRFRELLREKGLVDYWEQFGWPDLCHPTDDGDFECD